MAAHWRKTLAENFTHFISCISYINKTKKRTSVEASAKDMETSAKCVKAFTKCVKASAKDIEASAKDIEASVKDVKASAKCVEDSAKCVENIVSKWAEDFKYYFYKSK